MSDSIVLLPGSTNFESISEFKDCIIRGGEPVFAWKGVCYGVCFHGEGYCIAHEDGKGEQLCKTPDGSGVYCERRSTEGCDHASYCSGTLTLSGGRNFEDNRQNC